MRHFYLSIVSTSILLISGCANWPNEGRGGKAERDSTNLISVEYGHNIEDKHGLRFDYELIKSKLSILKIQGAEYCFPASIVKAELLETRIIRELTDSLYDSASINIIKQRIALNTLDSKLQEVLEQEKCSLPQENTNNKNKIFNLLNSDNQFATNSIELNQKYKENLKQAIPHIIKNERINILIIGHTDDRGMEKYNLLLSQKRANEVKKYLVNNGIKIERIKTIGSGKYNPRYEGNSNATKLINRNVQIFLVEG